MSKESDKDQQMAISITRPGGGVDEWLRTLGFQHNPFAFSEAERMPPEILEGTFVGHPGFGEIIIDYSRSAVLVAPRGGGKTASRLRLEIDLNRHQKLAFADPPIEGNTLFTPLVVIYNNFERVVQHLPNTSSSDHVESLLAAIAEAVYTFMTTYPDQFKSLSNKAQDWWWAFLATYLKGESLNFRLQETSLVTSFDSSPTHPPPFRSGSTLKSILESLLERLIDLGLDNLFILVDGVDGYAETQSLPNLKALVEPLLNTLPLLSLPGVVWKFFFPQDLVGTIRRSAGYQTGRLNLASIIWDEKTLIDLLRLRLEWASDSLVQGITQLCDEKLLREVDVDQELVRMALQHKRLGPPRALLHLGSQLLQKLAGKRLISQKDWDDFKEQYEWMK